MTAAKPLCVADGCHRPQHGRGYCATHLWRLKHVGSLDLQPRQPKPRKPCTAGKCDAPMWAKGLCELHYKRWRKTGSTELPTKPDVPCSVDGCDRRAVSKGMCNTHYRRAIRWGELPAAPCSICGKPVQAQGLCKSHYSRWRRHGDPTAWRGDSGRAEVSPRNPNGAGSKQNGYHLIGGMHGHPLATARGYVRVHRLTLWDAIGSGPHPCHHCGTTVYWDRKYPQHLDALVVDHLDHDTFNNDVSNLVPSCNTCNFARRRPDGTRNKERSA